jgi:hypothetical protein
MNTIKSKAKAKLVMTEEIEGTIITTSYRGFAVSDLPVSFGTKSYTDRNGEDREGNAEWFNLNGLTYIKD